MCLGTCNCVSLRKYICGCVSILYWKSKFIVSNTLVMPYFEYYNLENFWSNILIYFLLQAQEKNAKLPHFGMIYKHQKFPTDCRFTRSVSPQNPPYFQLTGVSPRWVCHLTPKRLYRIIRITTFSAIGDNFVSLSLSYIRKATLA